jgi:hypothetical protein
MAKKCSVCTHADAREINKQLVSGVPLKSLSKVYELSTTALHRHKQEHLPTQLAKSQGAKEAANATDIMTRVADLDAKAADVYARAIKAKNLSAAIGAVRELRGITELYARVTGELQAQNVTNIVIAPEWVSLRNAILVALGPYPEARQAVIEAVGRVEP